MPTTRETPAQRINELIRCGAFGVNPEETPFLCECTEPGCHAVVWLSTDEYDALRAHGAGIAITGHKEPEAVGSLIPLDKRRTPDVPEQLAS
jgi:hypothetical protein